MAKELKHVGASASIVIPIRLQVTAENLTQIERFRTHLLREFEHGQHWSPSRAARRHGVKVHQVTIDTQPASGQREAS